MDKIYEGKPHNERLDLLRANCRSTEKQDVKVYFSEDDLAEMKSRLSENSIERNDLQMELADVSKDFKAKIKVKTTDIKGLLKHLKNKFEYQSQEVFEFDDQTSPI